MRCKWDAIRLAPGGRSERKLATRSVTERRIALLFLCTMGSLVTMAVVKFLKNCAILGGCCFLASLHRYLAHHIPFFH